jgi:drug/metabolite transporter (DMT)-like permease
VTALLTKSSLQLYGLGMTLPPVLLLPVSDLLFGEWIGWQANLGTLLASIGVALLFLACSRDSQ